eukprot:TRINITY_DN1168_c0_g1_i3.p1 TRINITY_DN1168_c0_g1~~TRINITY_DN1168_c0_g1_i3.p1  ORF type:complete len:351 (+),score=59.05 TRINITY_DN1168_c0_g1_i3:75-1127(+)
MGCTGSSGNKEEKEKSKAVEAQLKTYNKEFLRQVKLLLLGAGESGKSTIAKQMKIIHLSGFTEDERLYFKDVIHSNILGSAKALIQAAENFSYSLSKKTQSKADTIMNLDAYPFELTPELAEIIAELWADPSIKKAFSRSSEFQLLDSTEYYFENIERISQKDYVPSEQDVLRSRAKTTGITETEFEIEGANFKMVDVGGQRSERKKWIHCFEDVTAIIFCVALSEYDLKLYEDENINRMHESLKLFDEICNSKWFMKVSIILFFNKSDIFKEKIKKVDLKVCFSDYDGGLSYDNASRFILDKFTDLNQNPDLKQIYSHITCATDTQNIKFVFNSVKDIILHKALDVSGL